MRYLTDLYLFNLRLHQDDPPICLPVFPSTYSTFLIPYTSQTQLFTFLTRPNYLHTYLPTFQWDVLTGYLPISCQPTSLSTFLPTYLPNFQATCALLHIYLNTYHTYLPNSTRCTYLPSLIDSSRSAWWRPSSPAWWLLLSISVSNPKH